MIFYNMRDNTKVYKGSSGKKELNATLKNIRSC